MIANKLVLGLLPLFLFAPGSGRATPVSDYEAAAEALITAATDTFHYLPRLFGVSPAPVSFSSEIDPAGQTLSFSTMPGQTYAGLPFVLTVDGIYKPSLLQWSFSASGELGSDSLDSAGSLFFADSSRRGATDKWFSFKLLGVEFDIESVHDLLKLPDGTDLSSDFYTLTVNGDDVTSTNPVGFDHVDGRTTDITFDFGYQSGTGQGSFIGSGSSDATTGAGLFTIQVVPEPPGISLMLVGILGLASLGRIRQRIRPE